MKIPRNSSEDIVIYHPQFTSAISKLQNCLDSFGKTAEPICIPVLGVSGSGKSTIINHLLKKYPTIDHKDGLDIPILRVDVPARPTVKSLAETLLYTLGDPLWDKGNTVHKSIRLRELLTRCKVRILALDEFQHFVDVNRANVANDAADWLKEQLDRTKVSIVVLGLQRCQEVLLQNEQLRRRFRANIYLRSLDWDDPDDRHNYLGILKSIQENFRNYSMPALSDLNLAYRMYYGTHGLIGYTMKLVRKVEELAKLYSQKKIAMELFAEAYQDVIWHERLEYPNPFLDSFDPDEAPRLKRPEELTHFYRKHGK